MCAKKSDSAKSKSSSKADAKSKPSSKITKKSPARKATKKLVVTKESSRKNTKTVEKKKRVAKKDPNAPKRPLSSYMVFCQEQRDTVKRENENMGAKDILKELGARWGLLSDEEKQPYKAKFEKNKKIYASQKEKYDAEKANESSASEEEDEPKRKYTKKAPTSKKSSTVKKSSTTKKVAAKKKSAKQSLDERGSEMSDEDSFDSGVESATSSEGSDEMTESIGSDEMTDTSEDIGTGSEDTSSIEE